MVVHNPADSTSELMGVGAQVNRAQGKPFTHRSVSKATFFWTILGRPAIKGHEAGRAQL